MVPPSSSPIAYGCQSMSRPIQHLLLMHPRTAFRSQAHIDRSWRTLHYLDAPDFGRAVAEYDRFAGLLEGFGMALHFLPDDERTTLDALYTHDPALCLFTGTCSIPDGRFWKCRRKKMHQWPAASWLSHPEFA